MLDKTFFHITKYVLQVVSGITTLDHVFESNRQIINEIYTPVRSWSLISRHFQTNLRSYFEMSNQ